ncbi:MAG: IMP cyclohydrolase [Candidatus Aminicenantes bacterium]|nr:IMP cyclohydrolase [Candidatus Aminicenantes bacterium]
MPSPLSLLENLAYPGRLIVIGWMPGGAAVVIYAITGRSASSQARRLVQREAGIWVEPTDEAVLRQGRVDLLVYPALLIAAGGVAVSNGKQTADIRDALVAGAQPVAALGAALARWDYEPDAPTFTPRISGCVTAAGAALGIVKRAPDGVSLRSYFEVPASPDQGRLVSTYQGENRDPLPASVGEPLAVDLPPGGARETAEAAYAALAPRAGSPDFRVAVACYRELGASSREVHIINRQERT